MFYETSFPFRQLNTAPSDTIDKDQSDSPFLFDVPRTLPNGTNDPVSVPSTELQLHSDVELNEDSSNLRRSSRIRKTPQYLQEFHCNALFIIIPLMLISLILCLMSYHMLTFLLHI